MNQDTRDVHVAGSYPTFWDEPTQPPPGNPVAPDQAYSEFVNLIEDEFPSGEYRADVPASKSDSR